ncbi:MAG: tRNA lysidine(34) synthetase TilS [Balneola sp.]
MSKSEFDLIEEKVAEKINQYFSERPKFVVGVSGGADSMALLYILKELEVEALIVHVNYGLRGVESDKDQELVEGMSFEWGFECCSIQIDAKESGGTNFQDWARNERYRFFKELKEDIGADGVITAHHEGDQIETIIQKLFRGSSPETWSGMSDWDGRLFRPLLELSKNDILNYCKEKAIPFRTDKSNLESTYARNFLRNDLSKELSDRFPGWQKNVLKLQEFGRLNEMALSELSKQYFSEKSLDINALTKLDKFLGQAILKKFINQFMKAPSKGIIEEAYNLMEAQTGAELQISDSIKLVKDRFQLRAIGKELDFNEQRISKEMVLDGYQVQELNFAVSDKVGTSIYMDIEKIRFPLILRRWKAGDKIQPLGMAGTQKVSDHLTNRKVSTVEKEKTLVLCDTDSTIYAIIFTEMDIGVATISDICKTTDSTKEYLLVTTKKKT